MNEQDLCAALPLTAPLVESRSAAARLRARSRWLAFVRALAGASLALLLLPSAVPQDPVPADTKS